MNSISRRHSITGRIVIAATTALLLAGGSLTLTTAAEATTLMSAQKDAANLATPSIAAAGHLSTMASARTVTTLLTDSKTLLALSKGRSAQKIMSARAHVVTDLTHTGQSAVSLTAALLKANSHATPVTRTAVSTASSALSTAVKTRNEWRILRALTPYAAAGQALEASNALAVTKPFSLTVEPGANYDPNCTPFAVLQTGGADGTLGSGFIEHLTYPSKWTYSITRVSPYEETFTTYACS